MAPDHSPAVEILTDECCCGPWPDGELSKAGGMTRERIEKAKAEQAAEHRFGKQEVNL